MSIFHFNEAIKLLNLEDAVNYRNKHNTSGNLPYHNNTHMDWMLEDCINALIFSELTHQVLSVWFNAIFHAAIFHDCNHSGGKLPDDQNIDNAIMFWNQYATETSTGKLLIVSSPILTTLVPFLLRATQYPYVDLESTFEYNALMPWYSGNPLAEIAAILRDADLMTVYHGEQGFDFINNKLYLEMSGKGSTREGMTYHEYTIGQDKFLRNRTWHSDWGKRRAELLNYPSVMQDALYHLQHAQWNAAYH